MRTIFTFGTSFLSGPISRPEWAADFFKVSVFLNLWGPFGESFGSFWLGNRDPENGPTNDGKKEQRGLAGQILLLFLKGLQNLALN